MDVSDCWYSRDQAGLQGIGVDVSRDGVEEDEDGLPEERPGADTDEEDDDEGEDGVEIVLVLPVGQPDHGGADQDHHAAESVRQDVEEDALNIELLTTYDTSILVFVTGLVRLMRVVRMSVSRLPVMTVTVTTEYKHSEQIYEESHAANYQDHLGVLNLLHHEEPLDRLDGDGEAERVQEDGVDESPDDLCPCPAEGVVVSPSVAQSGDLK